MIVDSHCHLNFYEKDEKEQILKRASDNNVCLLHNICITLDEFPDILNDANNFKNVYASVGVHPCHIQDEEVEQDIIESHTLNSKVISIGETGLDFYRQDNPVSEKQIRNFKKHISASRNTGLPLVIHSRNADKELADLLSIEMSKGKFLGLLHCFTGSQELAYHALDLGLYISFSGILTFKGSGTLREIAKNISKDKILIETDAPFLAPEPHRGKKNEPSMIVHTAECLSELIGETLERTIEITSENFFTLFKKAKLDA